MENSLEQVFRMPRELNWKFILGVIFEDVEDIKKKHNSTASHHKEKGFSGALTNGKLSDISVLNDKETIF